MPAGSTIERVVNSIVSRTESSLMEQIHERLPDNFCGVIDALIFVAAGLPTSRLEALARVRARTHTGVINRSLRAANSLREMHLGDANLDGLPGVTASTVAHYAELVQRYDAAHLRGSAAPQGARRHRTLPHRAREVPLGRTRHDASWLSNTTASRLPFESKRRKVGSFRSVMNLPRNLVDFAFCA